MSLSKEDKEYFASLLKKPETNQTMDLLFRGLSTLSIGLIIWIFSTTNQLKQDVEVIKNSNQYTSNQLKDLEDFTRIPRFTKEDFTQAINPLINNVNKNTIELNSRTEFMKDVENRLIKLEIYVKNK